MRARSVLAGCLLFLVGCAADPEPIDLLLVGADVYTVDPAQPWAEAVAVRDGRIVAVGARADLESRFRATERLDLDGMMVLPGFHDSHVHPEGAGVELAQCNLNEEASVEAIVDRVRACDAAEPGAGWLVGGGWDLSLFPEAHPRKALLDAISSTRPIALTAADGHSMWVNSAALARAGIDAATANPPNGVIERDRDSGEATGTLRESAQGLVRAVLPPLTTEARVAGLERAQAVLNGFGVTSLIDAAVDADNLATYRDLLARGALTLRVVASVESRTPDLDALVDPSDRGSGARLRVDAVKFFLDGVLEGETAALLEPYIGRDGKTGTINIAPEALAAQVRELDAKGVQVHVHAIGDRATRVALDAIAAAVAANGRRDNRHHIAHLQLIDPADYPRFGELGVTATFQALWAFPDAYITGVNLPVVGQQRVDRMYPIGSLHRANARIVAGSDWSVSSANPLLAIETALTRSDPLGRVPGVLNAAEAVPLETMIAAYTINGAYLMHQEDQLGSIAIGKLADLVVLDRNLFEIPPSEISDVQIVRTLLEGETVFAR